MNQEDKVHVDKLLNSEEFFEHPEYVWQMIKGNTEAELEFQKIFEVQHNRIYQKLRDKYDKIVATFDSHSAVESFIADVIRKFEDYYENPFAQAANPLASLVHGNNKTYQKLIDSLTEHVNCQRTVINAFLLYLRHKDEIDGVNVLADASNLQPSGNFMHSRDLATKYFDDAAALYLTIQAPENEYDAMSLDESDFLDAILRRANLAM